MASRITFIVGNGLDLSLGLKTRYKDFYEHINKVKKTQKNQIYQEIETSPETWSDFEWALGKYTSYIEQLPEKERKKASINFHEDLEIVRDDLADYLDAQESSIENLSDNFSFNFMGSGYFEELRSGQRDIIQTYVSSPPIIVNFITLNYTKTLEKILADGALSNSSGFRVGTPLHIHGNLLEDLTLGVSDESQLASGMSPQEKEDLIKPVLIASMNDGRMNALRSHIDNSSLIVLFGASLGDTDKYIWQYIVKWLLMMDNRRIIVHKYDGNYIDSTRRSSRKQKQFIRNVQDKLLNHSNIDESRKEELRSRVFVIHNTKKLFVKKSVK